MFKTKKRKEQDQLDDDIQSLWEAYRCENVIRIDPFSGEEYIIQPEDLAYEIVIAKDLDSSPRNWARFDRLIDYIKEVFDE